MALTFPLSLAAFADKLFGPERSVSSVSWLLQDNRELSGLGSGQFLEADLAPALWAGEVTLRPFYHADARRIEALLNAVIRSKGDFYLYDPRLPAPSTDPKGTTLGASTVQINSLPDAKSMSLKGLPPAYAIPAGSYLSFDYGTPARRAFHEFSEDATANGSGVTPAFEVSPFIRTGAAVNQTVTLYKPAAKVRIKPGTLSVQSAQDPTFTTISFSVVQKL